MKRRNLKGLSRGELQVFVEDIGEKPFRARQLWSWIYEKGIDSFADMTDLSKPLRDKLDAVAVVEELTLHNTFTSKDEGTKKFVWKLYDGEFVESVYIPEANRRTICISTQVGCRLKCSFCATGRAGCSRNLDPWEIVDQVLSIRRLVEERPTNIVVMGMGEPFLNYDNVIKALKILNDPEGTALSHRKITISTAGIIPQMRRYTKEGHPFKLAVSLNATTNALRSRLMPVNKKYPLEELLEAARQYTKVSGKRITFEYVLIEGLNDTPPDARRLLTMLRDIPCKVNLIACNPSHPRFRRPGDEHIQAFAESIRPLCAPVTLRLSRGDDIRAACGQLATRGSKPKPAKK